MKNLKIVWLLILISFVGCRIEYGENSQGSFVVQRPSVWCFSPGPGETLCYTTVEECINAERNEGDRPRVGCRAVRQ